MLNFLHKIAPSPLNLILNVITNESHSKIALLTKAIKMGIFVITFCSNFPTNPAIQTVFFRGCIRYRKIPDILEEKFYQRRCSDSCKSQRGVIRVRAIPKGINSLGGVPLFCQPRGAGHALNCLQLFSNPASILCWQSMFLQSNNIQTAIFKQKNNHVCKTCGLEHHIVFINNPKKRIYARIDRLDKYSKQQHQNHRHHQNQH